MYTNSPYKANAPLQKGQVENAETETEVRKRKYENGNMEVSRLSVFSALLTHEGVCVEAL